MLSLTIFPFVLAALQPVTTTQLQNARFLDEDAQVVWISPATTLDADRPGDLLFEFAFQSPLFDAAQGVYRLHEIRALWSLDLDGAAVEWLPEGRWFGTREPVLAAVQEFDQTTGQGRASLALPIGRVLRPELRYPNWGHGANLVSVTLGWNGELGTDGTGLPTGVLWNGSLDVAAAFPPVRIVVLEPLPMVGDVSLALLVLREPASTTRTFTLSSTVDGVVTLEPQSIVVEPGLLGAEFQVTAAGVGRYRLRATEGGTQAALSRKCRVVSARVMLAQVVEGNAGSPAAPLGDPIEIKNWSRCAPATCVGPGVPVYNHCGACTSDTPQVNCPETSTFYTPADCPFAILSNCYPAGTQSLRCGKFNRLRIDRVECGSVSILFPLLAPITGTRKFYQLCCLYTSNGEATIYVNQCF